MRLFPKKLDKYFYLPEIWVQRNQWEEYILRDWIFAFFAYCLDKKHSFYWAWDKFMVYYKTGRAGKNILIVDIPMSHPPFLLRKRYNLAKLTKGEVFALFVNLYDHFLSSTKTLRNRQSSVKPFLSFQTFVELCFNKDVSFKVPLVSPSVRQDLLLIEITDLLASQNIQPRDRCLIQQVRKFSIPTLRDWLRS